MDKVYNYFTGVKTITILIIGTAIVFLFSLFNRYIYVDDAWFGEQAYWFLKLGYVKTSTIIDFYDWDQRLFVYHKLNIIIGAALIKIFGWSVGPIRGFTLFVFLIFLFIVYKIFKSRELAWNGIDGSLVFFFLIINPMTLLYAFTYRPEILVMSLGFFSFLLLSGKRTNYRLFWSAVLAGTAMLVHLNGVMFIVAGFALLLIRRKWKSAFVFGLIASFVTSFYFYDLWQAGHFDAFLFQIRHWPDNITTNYKSDGWLSSVLNVLSKLGNEHSRFFWSPDVWGISSLFVFALLAKGKMLWRKHKDLIVYFIFADIALNTLGSHIAEIYMLLLLPFMALIVASFLTELKKSGKPYLQIISIIIILFQLISVTLMFNEIFNKRENTVEIAEQMLSEFPENNEKVLVPPRFVFNQLPIKNLVSYKTMEYHQDEYGRKYTKEEFLQLAVQLGIHHLVISPEMLFSNKMYPWMNDEFKGEKKGSFIRLKIEAATNRLIRVE